MEVVNGQIVQSRKGRDVGRWYMVVGHTEERVLVADGAKWTKNEPKAKNPRHLNATGTVLAPEAAGTDVQLKKALQAYEQGRAAKTQTQGGK